MDDFRTFRRGRYSRPDRGRAPGPRPGHPVSAPRRAHALLVHLVDVSEASGRDPVHDFEMVMRELASFSEDLAQKPMMVVATKIDAAQDRERVASLEAPGRGARPAVLRDFERDRDWAGSAEVRHCRAGAGPRAGDRSRALIARSRSAWKPEHAGVMACCGWPRSSSVAPGCGRRRPRRRRPWGRSTGCPPVSSTTTTSLLRPTSLKEPNQPRCVRPSLQVPVFPMMVSSWRARRAVPYSTAPCMPGLISGIRSAISSSRLTRGTK